MVVELPVRLAVEFYCGGMHSTVEEAVLAWPSDQPVEAPPLEEVVGPEAVAPPLDEVVGAEAVVLLAVVLLAHNRCRSQGHGYRRCYRCRDRGRYHHPDPCHRYRGASPSHPSHLCRLSFLSNSFQAPGKMVGQIAPSEFVRPMATGGSPTFFHHFAR